MRKPSTGYKKCWETTSEKGLTAYRRDKVLFMAIFPSGRTGSSGERRTPRPAGMPGTTALTHPHQCPPFLQVKSAKPLADGFSGTINAQAGFLVTPLIPLLPCHKQATDVVMFILRGKLDSCPRSTLIICTIQPVTCLFFSLYRQPDSLQAIPPLALEKNT